MWLATKDGFFSIVKNTQSKKEKEAYFVRARKSQDLRNAFPKKIVYVSRQKDYAYRVLVSKTELKKLMNKTVNDLDYYNFKDTIKKIPNQRDKVPFYNEIWAVMNDYQSKFIKGLYNFLPIIR